MRWGSGATAYRGELLISESGASQAHVEINLHFRDGGDHAPQLQEIEQSLDQSLERLKAELTR